MDQHECPELTAERSLCIGHSHFNTFVICHIGKYKALSS